MSKSKLYNEMTYTATNIEKLIHQINPKGYALCRKIVKHTAKVNSFLTIDSDTYMLSHPSAGLWIAKIVNQ